MNTSATSPLTRSIKHLCAASAAVVLVFGAATAKADLTIYSQNFNSFPDNTNLSAGTAGWYYWPGTGGATNLQVVGGKAITVGGGTDSLLDFGSDIFSYGYSHVTIEMDVFSKHQADYFFAPGTASSLNFNYVESFGLEHGSGITSVFYAGGFHGDTAFTDPTVAQHWIFDLNKAGNVVTFSATYDSTPFFAGTANVTVADGRGINTMEWTPLEAGTTMDNIVVTGVSAPVPEPTSALLMVAGGVSLLARRRREVRK